ncbi:Murinoglobulin-1 [Gryllus bimaculatus]|nr:Murinoglobulin-1 [Gryllus bimaculatus]
MNDIKTNYVIFEKLKERSPGSCCRVAEERWRVCAGAGNRALDVEATAYGALSLLRAGGRDHFLQALDAVRWLARNANAHGGFVSTQTLAVRFQDTVVALEALTQYASLVPQQRTALSLLLTASGVQEKFHIGHEDRLILQTVPLPELPTRVEVQAEGEGCALIQASLRYNVKTPSGSDAFELDVKTGPVASVDACAVQRVEACVRFKLPGQTSNMAVLEVNMVSGYKPDRSSLHHLAVNQGPKGFKRWEEEEDKVNFYFEELTNKWNCVSFLISQEADVENPTFAVVTVYDYYRQELSLSQKYSTDAGCRNERLPDPQPQIADQTLRDLDSANVTLGDAPSYTPDSGPVPVNNETGIPEHLNQQFVNVDDDLETPTGNEGPDPAYALPQSDRAMPSEEEFDTNCPHCTNTAPQDFSHLYCNSTIVYKMALKKAHARILLDLTPRRAPKRFRKNVVLRMDENCDCEPLKKVGEIQHFIMMSKQDLELIRTNTHSFDRLMLDERISIFHVPVQPGQPELIKKVRQSCV